MALVCYSMAEILSITDANSAGVYGNCLNTAAFLKVAQVEKASACKKHVWKQLISRGSSAFRDICVGKDYSKHTLAEKEVVLKFLDASWSTDIQSVVGCEMEVLPMLQSEYMKQALLDFESQIFNGTTANGGFDGLKTILNAVNGTTVISAGGTTVDAQTSVYAIYDDFRVIVGSDGLKESEVEKSKVSDATGKHYYEVGQEAHFYGAIALLSDCSVARLANVNAADDAPVTEDLLATLLANRVETPKYIVMNTKARASLQISNTNLYQIPMPLPTAFQGVPIIVTNAILNNEAVVA